MRIITKKLERPMMNVKHYQCNALYFKIMFGWLLTILIGI